MSNVIQLIESLGRNPALAPAAIADHLKAAAATETDEPIRTALLNGDVAALNDLLGARAKMFCIVAPAEDDEPQKDEEREPGEDEAEASNRSLN